MSVLQTVTGKRPKLIGTDLDGTIVAHYGFISERTAISQAFGAEVKKMGDFHVNAALAEAKRLGDLPGYFSPQQFDNDQNVDENREWLGQEILQQLPGKPDLLVSGVGTGGTVSEPSIDCTTLAATPRNSSTEEAPGVIKVGIGFTTGSAGLSVVFGT